MSNQASSNFRPLLLSSSKKARADQPPLKILTPKRKNTNSACLICRRRKIRCDGQEPRCSTCISNNTPCEYTTTDRQDNKIAKRQLVEAEERLKDHEELYSILQSKSVEESRSILDRIRSGQDVRTVLRHLQDGDLLLQIALVPETRHRYSFPYHSEMPSFLLNNTNPYLRSRMYKLLGEPTGTARDSNTNIQAARVGDEAQYRAPYHAARIVEPWIDAARPSQWTAVQANDSFLRDLLRAYFLHEYPMYLFFHKDYFLEDMSAGRNRFCSSLLVNATLAAACHCNTRLTPSTEFWNPQSIQYQFMAEARRLRELEVYEDSLTTVQATMVMALTYNMNAMDKIGWSYTEQAYAMARRIKLFDPHPVGMDDKTKSARGLTAWAIFAWQSMFTFHFFRSPMMKPPLCPLSDPKDSPEWYPELWILYPLSQSPIPVQLGEHFKTLSEFRAILNEIAGFAFGELESARKLSFDEAWGFYLKLKGWYDSLPDSVSITHAVLPFQLLNHLHYFNILMILMEPFTSAEVQSEKDGQTRSPANVIIDAKIGFETVQRLYYLRHSFEAYDPLLLQFQVTLAFMVMKTLYSEDKPSPQVREAIRSTLMLALKGLREQANRNYLGLTTFRLLKDRVQGDDALLLHGLADVGAEEESTRTSIASHVKAAYPINVLSINEDPEEKSLGAMVAAYED